MRFSRYLDIRAFRRELADLKLKHGTITDRELERLERDRILIPSLRIRYPDSVERRWFKKGHPRLRMKGHVERNGPRWRAASSLEEARQKWGRSHSFNDPLKDTAPLDKPRREWRCFIQHPKRRLFVNWDTFRVRADCPNGPVWHADTVVTYYSTWQLLIYVECSNMGVSLLGNTEGWDWTGGGDLGRFQQSISFEPIRSLQAFRKFERRLDAVVWFAEEDGRNDVYILRGDHRRRQIGDDEHAEMERRSELLADLCRNRFRVTYPQLVELSKFLAERWADWHRIGHDNHAKAYKKFLAQTIHLMRYVRDVKREKLIDDVGRAGGHFKPILRVIFADWAVEWREDAERILKSFGRQDALLRADFSSGQVNKFLDFVEDENLFEFYWRWKSLNERAFSGDANLLAGLRSDLQGMALSVEHIVGALLRPRKHPKPTLFEKFKQVWPKHTQIGKLLHLDPSYRMTAHKTGEVDLGWFDQRQGQGLQIEVASDVVICSAVRGNAHFSLAGIGQLQLERLSVILIRGVMRAFIEITSKASEPVED
jgi:hypothetical protein